jgi:hypothetical protein
MPQKASADGRPHTCHAEEVGAHTRGVQAKTFPARVHHIHGGSLPGCQTFEQGILPAYALDVGGRGRRPEVRLPGHSLHKHRELTQLGQR